MAVFRDDRTGEVHVHIHGLVEANGLAAGGEEFDSFQLEPGFYRVQFYQPFAELPSVVCTAWKSGRDHLSVTVPHIAEDHFECNITGEGGMQMDSGFSFIAFGRAR